ncbi:MAG TPA: hypothetical protein VKX16_01020 [Chloroflexota bacterium]|nr:hypothetical protein [Chloroflexota bacterium]
MFRRYIGKKVLERLSKGKIQRPGRVQAMIRLPTLLRLGFALFRDERVPIWQRTAVVMLLVLIFSPIDVVGDLPVIGQFWDFTLAVTVLDWFVQMAPAHVVNEHIHSLGLEKKVPLRSG